MTAYCSCGHPPAPAPEDRRLQPPEVCLGRQPKFFSGFRCQKGKKRSKISENLPLALKQTLRKKSWMAWCVWQKDDRQCPGILNLNSLGNLKTRSENTNVKSCSTTPLLSLIIRLHPVPALWFRTTRPQQKPHNGTVLQLQTDKGLRFFGIGIQTLSSFCR